jgi:Fe-S-cluster containining protein
VEALAPEVFRISRLLKTFPTQQFEDITERLIKHAAIVKGVSVLDYHVSCPFLRENQCSIYDVRPAVCRKVHSTDVEKCKLAGSDVPESLEVAIKSEALIKGTADAYHHLKLSASGHYELGCSVLLALQDETLESTWYGGGVVFSEAIDISGFEQTI